jgi:hypothetical protein
LGKREREGEDLLPNFPVFTLKISILPGALWPEPPGPLVILLEKVLTGPWGGVARR